MKIEYNNLYTHFVLTTLHRLPLIPEKHRNRIEKYITGIVNHTFSKMYAIYANPEHVHFLVSRSPSISELEMISKVADSSEILPTYLEKGIRLIYVPDINSVKVEENSLGVRSSGVSNTSKIRDFNKINQ